ncbi:hypothetical protein HW555_012086, partial [Spodoptera exigua]
MEQQEVFTTEQLLRILEGTEDDEFSESLDEDDLEPTIAGHQELSDETPSTSGHDRHYRNRETEQFKWTTEGRPPEVAAFDDFSSGLHFTPSENFTELDVFQHFMDNDFMSFIVEMTNKFHNNFLLKVDLRMHSRLHRWYDVTVPEMQCFLTIMMLMTRNRVGGAVVSSLLKDFFGSNRHLYVDNWYTSPLLFKYLYDNNIYACGTVKQNRKCMANLSRKLNLHEMETQYSGSLM